MIFFHFINQRRAISVIVCYLKAVIKSVCLIILVLIANAKS